jgi:hypothetical protein
MLLEQEKEKSPQAYKERVEIYCEDTKDDQHAEE